MEDNGQQKPSELTSAQKFFTLVAHLRMSQKQFGKLMVEIKKCEDEQTRAALREQKAKLYSNCMAIEKLIDAEIDRADEYYTKHKRSKFWL